jgi:hypothetical protein
MMSRRWGNSPSIKLLISDSLHVIRVYVGARYLVAATIYLHQFYLNSTLYYALTFQQITYQDYTSAVLNDT